MKKIIEDKIYDILLQYGKHLKFIDYVEKNGYKHVDHIKTITDRVDYVYAIYAGSRHIKRLDHFEVVKSLDYVEFVVLNSIIDGYSIEDIVLIVEIIRILEYVDNQAVDHKDVELIIRSISQKLVPFAIRVHGEQEDLQVTTVDE